jgi:hypothetical protein
MSSQVEDTGVLGATSAAVLGVQRRLPAIAAIVVAAGALIALYANEARTKAFDSDGASQVLQAWDALHGNVLLKDWWLTDVSFYAVDIPQYALIEIFTGLGPFVVYVGAALTYTALVLLAAWLAKGRATGREAWVRAGIAAGVMIAPSLVDGTNVLLSSPDHVSTPLLLLLAWIAIDRMPETWRMPVVVGVLLTWDEISDPLGAVVGAVPVILVAGLRLLLRRPSRRVDIGLVIAAVASVGLSTAFTAVVSAVGGYVVQPTGTVFTPFSSIPSNLAATVTSVRVLFGADDTGVTSNVELALRLLHLAGVALVLWAFAVAVRRGIGQRDRVVPILVAGILVNLAAYALTSQATKAASAREIVAVLPFAAALAGRVLTPRIISLRLVPVLLVVALGYLGSLGYWATRPAQPVPVTTVANWLEQQHLTSGVGDYWAANATTAVTQGKVRVRGVGMVCGWFRPRHWNSKATWYDLAKNRANFLLLDDPRGTYVPAAVAQFGAPRERARVDRYIVLVWSHDILPTVVNHAGCPAIPMPSANGAAVTRPRPQA